MNFIKTVLIVLVILFLWPRQVQAVDRPGAFQHPIKAPVLENSQ